MKSESGSNPITPKEPFKNFLPVPTVLSTCCALYLEPSPCLQLSPICPEELALGDLGAPSPLTTTPKGHLHQNSGSTTEYSQLFLSAS